MFWPGRNREIEARVRDFVGLARAGVTLYTEAAGHNLEHGLDERFDALVERVHRAESQADDVRHGLTRMLYEQELLPEFRGDLLALIEQADRIPNGAQDLVRRIQTEQLRIPDVLQADYRELVELIHGIAHRALACVETIIRRRDDMTEALRAIDREESLADGVEHRLLVRLFREAIPTENRLLLRDLVLLMGDIPDLCEDIGNAAAIFHLKHRA